MKCKYCGNEVFEGKQLQKMEVRLVQEDGFKEPSVLDGGVRLHEEDGEVVGPFKCTCCGARYQTLDPLDSIESPDLTYTLAKKAGEYLEKIVGLKDESPVCTEIALDAMALRKAGYAQGTSVILAMAIRYVPEKHQGFSPSEAMEVLTHLPGDITQEQVLRVLCVGKEPFYKYLNLLVAAYSGDTNQFDLAMELLHTANEKYAGYDLYAARRNLAYCQPAWLMTEEIKMKANKEEKNND